MRKIILHKLTPWISVILFTLALLALHRELQTYRYHDVVNSLKMIPGALLASKDEKVKDLQNAKRRFCKSFSTEGRTSFRRGL
jgi:hypothetical protein